MVEIVLSKSTALKIASLNYRLVIIFSLVTSLVAGGEDKQKYWNLQKHPAIVERAIVGFTAPSRKMDVATEFDGRVEAVLLNEGDTVIGEADSRVPVVILDNRFAAIAMERAKTTLRTAVQRKEQLKVDLALAKRQLGYHRNEVERIEALAKSGKVTQTNLDATVFNADSSALQVERVQTAILLADTAITEARHALDDAEERLARHSIDAPTGWIVLQRLVEPGVIVRQGESVLRLADVGELAIQLRLSEVEIAALQATKAIFLSFPRQEHPAATARIHHIEVDHDPITNKRLVELWIPGESAPSPTGGLEVSVTLKIPDPGGLVLVPRDFLTLRFEQYFVTLKDGSESTVIPLREQGNYVFISQSGFPDGAILTRPRESGQ